MNKYIIEGVEYENVHQVCKAHNLTPNGVYGRVASMKFPEWKSVPTITSLIDYVYPEDIKQAFITKMTGHSVSEETKAKIGKSTHCRGARAVDTPKGWFPSVSSAAKAYGISPAGMLIRIRRGLDEFKYSEDSSKIHRKHAIKCKDRHGRVFDTMHDAAIFHNLADSTIHNYIHNNLHGWTRYEE